MDKNIFKKPDTPDFSNPHIQKMFIEDAHSKSDLIKKEIEVNKAEQLLLGQPIQMMSGFVNDLPASDPHYSMLLVQVQMDRVEIDELKSRETNLAERLSKMEEYKN